MEQHSSINDARLPVLAAFGQMVREFRKAQGFSQESFVYYCGLDRSYMGGVERGERNITLANMEIIITVHELPPGSPSFCPHPHRGLVGHFWVEINSYDEQRRDCRTETTQGQATPTRNSFQLAA